MTLTTAAAIGGMAAGLGLGYMLVFGREDRGVFSTWGIASLVFGAMGFGLYAFVKVVKWMWQA